MKRAFTTCLILLIIFESLNIKVNAEKYIAYGEDIYTYTNSLYGQAVKLFEIAYGQTDENVRRTEIIEDSLIITPQSFTIDQEGNFYILDTLNYKVKKYSTTGVYLEAISLPEGVYGKDIEVLEDTIFIYTDDNKLYAINKVNPKEYACITEISRENIAALYVAEGDLYIRSYNGSDKKIEITENLTQEKAVALNEANNWSIYQDDTIIGLSNSSFYKKQSLENDLSYSIKCLVEPLGAFCIKKSGNNAYILSNETDWHYAETRITKVLDNTISKSALAISGKVYDYGEPFKKIYVFEDNVYQMIPELNGLSFYLLPWSTEPETRFSNEMINAYIYGEENEVLATATKATNFSVTRDEVLERAYNMCFTGWHYDADTMHTPDTGTTASPAHLQDTSKNVAGIPYCWGGMNGLDTATYTGSSADYLRNFSDCLTSSSTAGNVRTSSDYNYISGTFGLDCSGLVCAAFKITNKIGTLNLGNYFTESSWENIQEGDVAIKAGSHTMIIKTAYFSESSGFYLLTTYESTTEGSVQGAKTRSWDYSTLCNNYLLYTY